MHTQPDLFPPDTPPETTADVGPYRCWVRPPGCRRWELVGSAICQDAGWDLLLGSGLHGDKMCTVYDPNRIRPQ